MENEPVEYQQAQEVLARAFELIQLTEAQRTLLLTAGARLYIRGCRNGLQAAMHAADAGRTMHAGQERKADEQD